MIGLDRRQLRRMRRREARRRREDECPGCGRTLAHYAGPGLERGRVCTTHGCDEAPTDWWDDVEPFDDWFTTDAWDGPVCPMCGGTGAHYVAVAVTMQPVKRNVLTGLKCPACNGHGREPRTTEDPAAARP